jgi:hypothetical protein
LPILDIGLIWFGGVDDVCAAIFVDLFITIGVLTGSLGLSILEKITIGSMGWLLAEIAGETLSTVRTKISIGTDTTGMIYVMFISSDGLV